MFRSKDQMLKEQRNIKKKNVNKEGKQIKINYKDIYSFSFKAIQQKLIKEDGIKISIIELSLISHKEELTEEERKKPMGNSTWGEVFDKVKNPFIYHMDPMVAKTHDMSRWKDNKEKTLNRKKGFNEKYDMSYD